MRIVKKQGHFSPAFSMLCIEAEESFPEIIYSNDFPHPRQGKKK